MAIRGKFLLNWVSSVLIVAVATIGFSASVWAAACAPKKLSQAEVSKEVRKVQTTLMVAALSCGKRDNYNKFVTKFKHTLRRYGQVMKSDFIKRYGGRAGKKKLNKYVTALANEASSRSNADYDAFCSDAGRLYNSLKDKKPKELGPFVSKPKYAAFGGTFKPGDCRPKKLFPDVRNTDPLGKEAPSKVKKKG